MSTDDPTGRPDDAGADGRGYGYPPVGGERPPGGARGDEPPGQPPPGYGSWRGYGEPPAGDPHWRPYGAPPGYLAPDYPAPPMGPNGLAIASLVLGILWLYWLGSILAVVLGHIALRQTARTGQSGRSLAVAGLVLGYFGIVTLFLVIALFAGAVSTLDMP